MEFEFELVHKIALMGFGIAAVFGAVANKTHFCAMGAISDWLHMNSKGRLGAWFFAIGLAILGTQALSLLGIVDLKGVRYLTPNFGWFSYALGGLLFGVGMTLGAGCGQRNLVRLGGGNMRSLVVLLVMGVVAYATMRGLLALIRIEVVEPANIDLAERGLADQGLTSFLGLAGIDAGETLRWVVAGIIGLGFILFALRQRSFRKSFDNVLVGLVIGLCVVAAWYVTGVLGKDEFEPLPVEGISFISSVGNTVNYVMTYTGSTISFSIALVLGMITGSFLYALLSGSFRIETFSNRGEMLAQLSGGALMGFGGVLSLGCTVGQGITGMSTLAVGSMIALVSIIVGSALTMRVQYHMLDAGGFFNALWAAVWDILIPARREAAF